ncbi:related to Retrotransposon protein [Ustilago trichophora]|uniref:Related to Retrotransposon protein n=1 Tax=Ustilago trichophora TaxID=86804 RepID=A0A5C3EBA0_9BASI|nr:related to Retrotransposon protein [Ustilago trichophora]
MDATMQSASPPVLQGSSDYYTWRRQLRIYVDGVNPMMWEAITGVAMHPANVLDERLRMSLQTTARRAVNILLRAVAPEIANVIKEDQTAHEIWKYLEKRYSKGTIIQPYVLLSELVQLIQIGGVNEFISNIERIANERALMGHPVDAGTKLGCLLRGVQPHLHPYTAAYEAQWESISLSKAGGEPNPQSSADLKLELERLFDTAAMGLRNYKESAQLKEREVDTAALAVRFTHQGSFQKRPLQTQQKATIGKQVVCWEWDEGGRGNGKGGGGNAAAAAENLALAALATGAADKKAEDGWIWDTGADVHICKDESIMTNLQKTAGRIQQAQGPPIKYDTVGSVVLLANTNVGARQVTLSNVILLRNGNFNLFSPRAAAKASKGDIKRDKQGRECIMVSKGQQRAQAVRAIERNGRTYLDIVGREEQDAHNCEDETNVVKKSDGCVLQALSEENVVKKWRMWHCRFGHASLDQIQKSLRAAGVEMNQMPKNFKCKTCNAMKFARPLFGTGSNKTNAKLDIVVSDLQGPMPVRSIGGARYVLTITDVHTRFGWVVMLVSKDATKAAVERWLEERKEETGQYPKVFRSDNGGEYTSNTFKAMPRRPAILQQLTAPYTPQQNGIAERRNRAIMDIVRPMLSTAGLDNCFWAEATHHANWIRNRTYSKVVKGVPYVLWTGQKARVSKVRTFGMVVWVKDAQQKKSASKLSRHAQKCVWVGIADLADVSHRCIDCSDHSKVYISRDVKFDAETLSDAIMDADISTGSQEIDGSTQSWEITDDFDLETVLNETLLPSEPQHADEIPSETDSSPLLSPTSSFYRELEEELATGVLDIQQAASIIKMEMAMHNAATEMVMLVGQDPVASQEDPQMLAQARASPNWPKWEEAIKVELDSLDNTGTWTIVDLPAARKAITAKWVFKTKQDADGNVSKYKARLVARGFTQMHGIDYHDTYLPVVSMTSLRLVICYGLKFNYRIRQIDFVAAYLNRELTDVDIYMQSGREWFAKLDECLNTMGFKQLGRDVAVYRLGSVAIVVYVDNVIIVGQDNEVNTIINSIKACFKITGGGDAQWCLGVRIQQEPGTVILSQDAYIDTILERFSMDKAAEANTPLDLSAINLSSTDPSHRPLTKEQVTTYQQIVGSVMYLMTATCPDLAFPVSKLASHLASPTTVHLNQARHLLRYILHTRSHMLVYSQNESGIPVAYSDADHAGSWKENPYSTSGFVIKLFGAAIAWRSRRQQVILTLTAEAETIALSDACHDVIWILEVLNGLNIVEPGIPIKLLTDNQAAEWIVSSDGPGQNKLLTLRGAFTKDTIEKGIVTVNWITSELQVADGLTKLLNA